MAQRRRRRKTLARQADKHELYQRAVQDPSHDLPLVERIFRRETGRRPLSLREDFCGTALMSAAWVRSHRERTATGIDLDASVLAWGHARNREPLGEDAERLTLLQQDVRDPVRGPFDLALAFNYSYSIFRTRRELRSYFESVRKSLAPDGLLVLDVYGGPEAQEVREERRRLKGGVTYVWDQDYVNPIEMRVVNYIHFRFRDGSELRRAFRYEWRLWSCPELRELLEEAGYAWVDFHFEDEDADGHPTGTYRRRVEVPNDPAWLAYVVAGKAPKRKRPKRGRRRT